MTPVLPELRSMPSGLLLDGELVAWKGSEPYFPHVCRRVLNRDMTVPLTFVVFDVRRDGNDLTSESYRERRAVLDGLALNGTAWTTSETFGDGLALFAAVCEHGLEGIVSKRLSSRYRSGERGWVKVKNPNYWRRDAEREAMQRARKRKQRSAVYR